MKIFYLIFVVATALLFQSCSKENEFKEVIDNSIKDRKLCFIVSSLPATVLVGQEKSFGEMYSSKEMDALVEIGLLNSFNTTKEVQNVFFLTGNRDVEELPAKTYNLSTEGEKYFNKGSFCFGKYKVKEIISYTKPTPFFGRTITEIKYSYVAYDIPEWISNSKSIGSAFNIEKQLKEEPIEGSIRLYETSKGWEIYK